MVNRVRIKEGQGTIREKGTVMGVYDFVIHYWNWKTCTLVCVRYLLPFVRV